MPKIILHFLTSSLCHKPRHNPDTPQLLCTSLQPAPCLLKPTNHLQPLLAVSSWQHLTLCIFLHSFLLILTPRFLNCLYLSGPSSAFESCSPAARPRGPSPASFSSFAMFCARGSLLLLCLQIPAHDFQSFCSSPDVSPEFPGIYPQAYWNPHLYEPQTPKFHYVHSQARHLPLIYSSLIWAWGPSTTQLFRSQTGSASLTYTHLNRINFNSLLLSPRSIFNPFASLSASAIIQVTIHFTWTTSRAFN